MYTYDNLNQLTRADDLENNLRYEYTYTLNNQNQGGNIQAESIFVLNNGVATLLDTKTYVYGDNSWGDLLTKYDGQDITYDTIGNPLTYRDGISFTWTNGRQLASYNDGTTGVAYTYGSDGMRLSKTVGNIQYTYLYLGGLLMQETRGNRILDYFYDANGQAIAVRYKSNANATGTYYYYAYNWRGDIVGLYAENGAPECTYTYDAWGKLLSVKNPAGTEMTSATYIGNLQSLKYRGYVYDRETGLYYLRSRYYDPVTRRFINADRLLSTGIIGYNMFAYCMNNPSNMSDPTGSYPDWIETVVNWVIDNIIQPIEDFFTSIKQNNASNMDSHDANRRPYTGEPGSTYTAPNGDSRTYGPDGTPKRDYDHDDHGRPDKHPHDSNGGHNHDWDDGVRGPAYSIGWEPFAGSALVAVGVFGMFVLAVDDATGIGVADDFLFGPLGAVIAEGWIMIFG